MERGHEIEQGTAPGCCSSSGSGKLGLSGDLLRDFELTPELLVLISELQEESENQPLNLGVLTNGETRVNLHHSSEVGLRFE